MVIVVVMWFGDGGDSGGGSGCSGGGRGHGDGGWGVGRPKLDNMPRLERHQVLKECKS